MVGSKQILCVLSFTILSTLAVAQNNTNSPYTRYGYGQLSDHNSAKNKAMGGVGYGIRDGLQMNLLNPASYSAVDSLTLLFEGGVTLQNTNFSDGVNKLNAKNSSFDYVAMQLRLHRKLGLTLGMVPFSNVGYSMSSVHTNPGIETNVTSYSGDGGLSQIFLGLGFKVLPNLSIGANANYIWGDINRTTQLTFPSTSTNTGTIYGYREVNHLSVTDFKFDFGLQYSHKFTKKHSATFGAVFTPAMKLNNDANITTATIISGTAYQSSSKDTAAVFGTPASFGAGVAYIFDNRLTVGVDYTLEKWSKAKYMDDANAFNDRQKIALGIEFLPSYMSRSYFSHIKYRIGAYYSKPYYKIRLSDTGGYGSSKEYGISAGIALPTVRRSIVNLNVQYVRVDGVGANMLDENYLRVGIAITFNERAFFKRKVD